MTAKCPMPNAQCAVNDLWPMPKTNWARAAILVIGIWSFFGHRTWVIGLCAETGLGPPISVPNDPPKPTLTKRRNLIDQTHEEALVKSRGCLECHKSVDDSSMHAS